VSCLKNWEAIKQTGTRMITTVPKENIPAHIFFNSRPLKPEVLIFLITRWCRGLKSIYSKVDHRRTVKKGAKSRHTITSNRMRMAANTAVCTTFNPFIIPTLSFLNTKRSKLPAVYP
jgi:hypothetical protein